MMTTGKIQFAESEGTFVLKFVGDVRLTLCAALDAYIEKIFSVLLRRDHYRSDRNRGHRQYFPGAIGQAVNSFQTESRLSADAGVEPGRHESVAAEHGLRSGVQYRQ